MGAIRKGRRAFPLLLCPGVTVELARVNEIVAGEYEQIDFPFFRFQINIPTKRFHDSSKADPIEHRKFLGADDLLDIIARQTGWKQWGYYCRNFGDQFCERRLINDVFTNGSP